jgi:hypothetical protein
MKRLSLLIAVACFTFMAGSAIVWLCPWQVLRAPVTEKASVLPTEEATPSPPSPAPEGQKSPYIKFSRFTLLGNQPYAEFRLVNESPEAVSYEGPAKSAPCGLKVKRAGSVRYKRMPNCECGNAWEPQMLLAGEAAPILVALSEERGAFQVGLEVTAGGSRRTLWSDKVFPPKIK